VTPHPHPPGAAEGLARFVPPDILALARMSPRRALPAIARTPEMARAVENAARSVPTRHTLIVGDSRRMDGIADESVHLAMTSPPYWTLKAYPARSGQLGLIEDYKEFLAALDGVWREVFRVLVPGGHLSIVVGDVRLPRRRFGRHAVVPLHAGIQERCIAIGFEALPTILWHKISNASPEGKNESRYFGRPYEPNGVLKNDIEYILLFRKPRQRRAPSLAARILSVIPEDRQREWFRQVWTLPGARTDRHPAPFPLRLAERLIRMFSVVDDTVLDPFLGTGTVSAAASRWGRNSVGIDIEPAYVAMAWARLEEGQALLPQVSVEVLRAPARDPLPCGTAAPPC
jgi:DNA modification methylase